MGTPGQFAAARVHDGLPPSSEGRTRIKSHQLNSHQRDPGPPPTCLNVQVPASLGFLPAVRSAVGAAARGIGLEVGVVAELRRMADELAAELIHYARPWACLEIAVIDDDEDIYLRMAVDQADPGQPLDLPMTTLVRAGVAESVDVQTDGARTYGIIQRGRALERR